MSFQEEVEEQLREAVKTAIKRLSAAPVGLENQTAYAHLRRSMNRFTAFLQDHTIPIDLRKTERQRGREVTDP